MMHNPYNELIHLTGPEELVKLSDAHSDEIKLITKAINTYYKEKLNKADLKRKIDMYV